jgi:hypothetical protein
MTDLFQHTQCTLNLKSQLNFVIQNEKKHYLKQGITIRETTEAEFER